MNVSLSSYIAMNHNCRIWFSWLRPPVQSGNLLWNGAGSVTNN